MDEIHYGFTLDCHVYEFNVVCQNQKIPYQLTLHEDLRHNRFNLVLLNLLAVENGSLVNDLRIKVCNCILDFLEKYPNSRIYFDIDLYHKRNFIKFIKFFRWYHPYRERINFEIESTHRNNIKYFEIIIYKRE